MPRIAHWVVILLLPGCFAAGDSKDDFTRAKLPNLTNACKTYLLNHGDWPPSLDALAVPQPDGGPPLLPLDELLDSWLHPFQYDPAGSKHYGEQPDIWCQTPQGKVIGNWEIRR